MYQLLDQVWRDVLGGLTGPMRFRFVLQPTMAAALALRAGVKDARAGRPPFLWALLTDRGHRTEALSHGWADVGRVFILAMLVDFVDQLGVHAGIHVVSSLLVATGLAVVPYVLLCGPVNRIARWLARRRMRVSA